MFITQILVSIIKNTYLSTSHKRQENTEFNNFMGGVNN